MGEYVPGTDELAVLSQQELDDIIRKHETFIKGLNGGARAVLKFRNLAGLNFRQANLSGADFTASLLVESDLSNGNFESACFFSCDMRGANLENAKFARADFRGAYVAGANLTRADLAKADLREGTILQKGRTGELVQRQGFGQEVKTRTIFTGAKLHGTSLSGARASSADFSDADLSGIIIKDADLRGANFQGANLNEADLTGSDIRQANFRSSIMTGTILASVESFGSDFEGAVTEKAAGPTLADKDKSLEDLLADHMQWIKTVGKEGIRLDLSGYDLRGVDELRDVPLTAIKASNAVFVKQNLDKAQIQSATLDAGDFRDCSLRHADFRGSNLKGSLLTRADLSGANFSPLYIGPAGPAQRKQTVNLSNADLRFTTLEKANFAYANLSGADLSNALVTACDFRNADLRGAKLPRGFKDDADLDGATLDS